MKPFDPLEPNYKIVDTVWPEGRNPASLVRGPKPDVIGMRRLFQQFKTVINLEIGWHDLFFCEQWLERDVCKAIGARYDHEPMSDIWPPIAYDLRRIVAEIHYGLQNGNVLVHCLHGEDRTGMVCAAYRIIHNGWTADAAIAEMKNNGFHTFPYFYWVNQLRKL